MADLGLFDTAAYAVQPPPPSTTGERRRARQATAIAGGYHPLSLTPLAGTVRLLDLADRKATKHDADRRPRRCGTCRWREPVWHGSRDYAKCLFGAPVREDGTVARWLAPRVTSGPGTDTSAWWPACTDYEALP